MKKFEAAGQSDLDFFCYKLQFICEEFRCMEIVEIAPDDTKDSTFPASLSVLL